MGLTLNYNNLHYEWDDISIPMNPSGYWNHQNVKKDGHKITKQLLPENYTPVSPEQITSTQNHLTSEQQQLLLTLLQNYSELFLGGKGEYPELLVRIDIKPCSPPVSIPPYSITHAYQSETKIEFHRLI